MIVFLNIALNESVGYQEVRHSLKLQTVQTHTKQTKSNIIQRSNIKRNCSACKGAYPVGASIVRAKRRGRGGYSDYSLSLSLTRTQTRKHTVGQQTFTCTMTKQLEHLVNITIG